MTLAGSTTLTFSTSGSPGSAINTFYVYICTKSTADPYIPSRTANVDILARDVSDGFMAVQGGRLEVGRLAFYPTQRSVANHLLCDGREVSKESFAELYAYIGDAGGPVSDPDNFKLPDYLTAFTPATVAVVETEVAGTVSTPPPAELPPTSYPEQEDKLWGGVDSGGKVHL